MLSMEFINSISYFGFFVCLVLLIVAAVKKQPKKPFAIGLAVCFLLAGSTSSILQKSHTDSAQPASAVEQPQEESTIEETLTKLAQDSIKNNKVPISVALNDGACVVHCEAAGDSAYFNEVDLVRSHLSAYIKFCLAAYDTGEVSSVDWWAETTMIDSKGNESSDKVVQFKMPKETFETYNWENMEYRPGMFQQFSEDCTVCYVHPGLLKNINTEEKLFYAP